MKTCTHISEFCDGGATIDMTAQCDDFQFVLRSGSDDLKLLGAENKNNKNIESPHGNTHGNFEE